MAVRRAERRTTGNRIFEPPVRGGMALPEGWGGAFNTAASATYGMKRVDGSEAGEGVTKTLTGDDSDTSYVGLGNLTKLSDTYRRCYEYADLMMADSSTLIPGDYVLHIRYRFNYWPDAVSPSAPAFYFQTHSADPLPGAFTQIGDWSPWTPSGTGIAQVRVRMMFPTTGSGYCSASSALGTTGADCYQAQWEIDTPSAASSFGVHPNPISLYVYGIETNGTTETPQLIGHLANGNILPYAARYPSATTYWARFELRALTATNNTYATSTLIATYPPYSAERQTIAGPPWTSQSPVPLGNFGGQSWVDYQMPLTIGELDHGSPSSWVGSLYTSYFISPTESTSLNLLSPLVAQRFPVLVSRVALEPYVPARKSLRVTGARSSVRFQ